MANDNYHELNPNKQNFITIGVVVLVLITLFTLSNLIPFVYRSEFADFKVVMLQNFADLKTNMVESAADRRDLRSIMELMRLDAVRQESKLAALQARLDSEDLSMEPPLPAQGHKKKKY